MESQHLGFSYLHATTIPCNLLPPAEFQAQMPGGGEAKNFKHSCVPDQ